MRRWSFVRMPRMITALATLTCAIGLASVSVAIGSRSEAAASPSGEPPVTAGSPAVAVARSGAATVDDPSFSDAVRPESRSERAPLDEVRWTVATTCSLETLALRWGLTEERLRELNPDLPDAAAAGQRLVVYRRAPDQPSHAVGYPHRGRLLNGMPLPEGDGWRLRESRRRAYGTELAISTLLAAFTRFANEYPDAPPIRVGELSGRRGGRAKPHVSHRTGRDVDIGYVLSLPDDGETRWKTATAKTFDAEKNWFLVKALMDSGNVEVIFVSRKLQPLLIEQAQRDLGEKELARYFRSFQPDWSEDTLITHAKGHRDHMHVRFRCEEGNPRCRSRVEPPGE